MFMGRSHSVFTASDLGSSSVGSVAAPSMGRSHSAFSSPGLGSSSVGSVAAPGGSWFERERYGMFVHANIATVPAFAPLHEYADWYWGFLETKPDIVLPPTCPMPEIVAWHREHFGDQPFDAFIPEL